MGQLVQSGQGLTPGVDLLEQLSGVQEHTLAVLDDGCEGMLVVRLAALGQLSREKRADVIQVFGPPGIEYQRVEVRQLRQQLGLGPTGDEQPQP